MKIVIAPDSFKGSLKSTEICEILESELRTLLPDAEIVGIPVADGGEGTLNAFNAARPGRLIYAKATGPWFNETLAPYLFYEDRPSSWSGDGSSTGIATAVIESAKVAGFISPASRTETDHEADHDDNGDSRSNRLNTPDCRPDPLKTTTYGLGLLIKDALSRSAEKIIIGLGGSCTNDGGCGMAAAMGTKFYGAADDPFVPTGGTLSEIACVDNHAAAELLGGGRGFFEGKAVDIVGMCDVTNPLCGMNGASHVFAPQKGASANDVLMLDEGMKHLVSVIGDSEAMLSGSALFPGSMSAKTLADLPGSGAAGGLGFGIRAFAGGRLQSGIDLLLDTADFDKHLWNTDYVITGEGHLDSQSLGGKAVSGICRRAKSENVRTIILCGTADKATKDALADDDIDIIETGPIDFDNLSPKEVKQEAARNMAAAVRSSLVDLLQ